MAVLTFTPASSTISPGFWEALDMLDGRRTFVETIFESDYEIAEPGFFRLHYSDATIEFQGEGLTYDFFRGEVVAITGGVLTGMTVTLVEGPVVVTLTGLSIPAPIFSSTLSAENSTALFNLLIDGDDRITAGSGADFLLGYDGNDTINGGGGHDTLRGDDGRDRLIGGTGEDWLFGGKGADVLIGGRGRDFLNGGGGNDRFVFVSLRDMTRVSDLPDEIDDFRQGQDVIDLRGIDAFAATSANDAFLFIGTARFGSATAGEVRFRQVDQEGTFNDHTLIEIDVDGDARAEALIRVNGLYVLTEQDFLL